MYSLKILDLLLFLIVACVSAQEECFDFMYAYLGPFDEGESVTYSFGCVQRGGCIVGLMNDAASGSKGCEDPDDFTEKGRVAYGEMLNFDDESSSRGSLICSTGQLTAMVTSNENGQSFELAPGSMAASKYIRISTRDVSEECAILNLADGNGNAVLRIATFGEEVIKVNMKKYSTEILQIQELSVTSFKSNNGRMLIGCFGIDGNAKLDFTILHEPTKDQLFGWGTDLTRGVQVNCDSLEPENNTPLCFNQQREVASTTLTAIIGGVSTIRLPNSDIADGYIARSANYCTGGSDSCLSFSAVEDGNANEATSWVSRRHFATQFVITIPSERFAILSDRKVFCTVNRFGANPEGPFSLEGDNENLKSFFIGDDVDEADLPTIVECDNPVMMVAQDNTREFNLFGLENEASWNLVGDSFRDPNCDRGDNLIDPPFIVDEGLPLLFLVSFAFAGVFAFMVKRAQNLEQTDIIGQKAETLKRAMTTMSMKILPSRSRTKFSSNHQNPSISIKERQHHLQVIQNESFPVSETPISDLSNQSKLRNFVTTKSRKKSLISI